MWCCDAAGGAGGSAPRTTNCNFTDSQLNLRCPYWSCFLLFPCCCLKIAKNAIYYFLKHGLLVETNSKRGQMSDTAILTECAISSCELVAFRANATQSRETTPLLLSRGLSSIQSSILINCPLLHNKKQNGILLSCVTT